MDDYDKLLCGGVLEVFVVFNSTVAGLQTAHPSTLIIILGDFNHFSIQKNTPEIQPVCDL